MKKKRCEIAFKKAKKEIKELLKLNDNQYIDVRFGDSSGFSLVPNIPYAWQLKNEPILLPSSRSKNLSVFGLMNQNGDLFHRTFEGTVNSDLLINLIDDFVKTITKKTVIILDNAPIHKSKKFTQKIEEWEELDVLIYFIPPYSPELNKIEILWRFIKYQWLEFDSYSSFENLKSNLNEVLLNFGSKYCINFL